MSRKKSKDPGLMAAIEAAGKVITLAKRIGISPSAISMWDRVPGARVPAVSRVTGVPRNVLRPDLYEEDEGARA